MAKQLTLESVGEEIRIGEPYPNEHACRLRDPGDFQEERFRRYERSGDGKTYSVIAGRLKGEDTMTEQAFRYPKDDWTAAAARAHCGQHDGSFEAASGEAKDTTIEGDILAVSEKALRSDGTMEIRIVQPGWGASGYYSPQLLERDGPKVFRAGTHMHWDHPTEVEEMARPEGSLTTLAGVLETDGTWMPHGPQGPGLYAKAKAFSPYREALGEMAPYIGVSLRGKAKGKEGEAEGRKGRMLEELTAADSVDFVTMPGAGGAILELFESARKQKEGEGDMALEQKVRDLEAEVASLKEGLKTAQDEAARLREAAVLAEAGKVVAAKLAEARLPDITKARLAPALGANPPVKDGALDKEALEKAVADAVAAEAEYIAKLRGEGKIVGMGEGGAGQGTALKEAWGELYRATGATKEAAEKLAELSM